MKSNNQKLEQTQLNDVERINNNLTDDTQASNQEEFKISVRKLQLPVRPRGVLAE